MREEGDQGKDLAGVHKEEEKACKIAKEKKIGGRRRKIK